MIKRRLKIFWKILLPSFLAVLLAFLFLVCYSAFSILYPKVPATEGSPESYLLTYEEIRVPGVAGSTWYLPGPPLNPSLFLCHDYSFNRLSALNLATSLNDAGYHVYVVGFRGHLPKGRVASTLGLREGEDLGKIIAFSGKQRQFEDGNVGVWGVGLGALAALSAGARDPHVKVLVLDSPYTSAYDLVKYQLGERIGIRNSFLLGSVGVVSALFSGSSPATLLDRIQPKALKTTATLYITGRDEPIFEGWARDLYETTPGYKEFLTLPRSRRTVLTTPEWNGYDLRVLRFYQRYLPLPTQPEKSDTPKTRKRRVRS